jgi:hypothetical protein
MSSDNPANLTVGALLFGRENEDAGALQLSPSWHEFEASLARAGTQLASSTRETLASEIGAAISDAEDIEVGDLMIYGWRTHRHLVEAARRTLKAPGRKEVVHLAQHQMTATRHPVVDLTASGVRLYSAHFTVTVTVDIGLADAVVKQGRLTKLTTGGFSVLAVLEAELPAGNVELLRRQKRVSSRLAIPLRGGIVLAAAPAKHAVGAKAPSPRHSPDAGGPPAGTAGPPAGASQPAG